MRNLLRRGAAPDVERALHAVAHPRFHRFGHDGEEPADALAVALADGASANADELIEHAATSIARYKLPKAVVFRLVIERSPAGKADYRWAREQAVSAD